MTIAMALPGAEPPVDPAQGNLLAALAGQAPAEGEASAAEAGTVALFDELLRRFSGELATMAEGNEIGETLTGDEPAGSGRGEDRKPRQEGEDWNRFGWMFAVVDRRPVPVVETADFGIPRPQKLEDGSAEKVAAEEVEAVPANSIIENSVSVFAVPATAAPAEPNVTTQPLLPAEPARPSNDRLVPQGAAAKPEPMAIAEPRVSATAAVEPESAGAAAFELRLEPVAIRPQPEAEAAAGTPQPDRPLPAAAAGRPEPIVRHPSPAAGGAPEARAAEPDHTAAAVAAPQAPAQPSPSGRETKQITEVVSKPAAAGQRTMESKKDLAGGGVLEPQPAASGQAIKTPAGAAPAGKVPTAHGNTPDAGAGMRREDAEPAKSPHPVPAAPANPTGGTGARAGETEGEGMFPSRREEPSREGSHQTGPGPAMTQSIANAPAPAVDSPKADRTAQSAPEVAAPPPVNAETKPAGATRQIRIDLGPELGEPLRLNVRESSGDVHVSVHSADAHLRETLRSELGELTRHLERTGFQVESLTPAAVQAGAAGSQDQPSERDGAYPDSKEQTGREGAGGRRQQNQEEQQPGRRGNDAWRQLIEEAEWLTR